MLYINLLSISDYISSHAPMTNLPALLGLHHDNPLGLPPIAIPIFLVVMAFAMHTVTYFIYSKERRNLYPLLYSLLWVSVLATYYYCFSGDLPLFTDEQLGRSEICVGWFCQRSIVGLGWSLLGVALLSYTTYSMLKVLMHIIAHQSDRMGLGEKVWREWNWIIIVMLFGASLAGVTDNFVPIVGVWVMVVYQVVIVLMTVAKMIADYSRTRLFGRCLLSACCFIVVFEAITMLAIECIEGFIYIFIPIVAFFASADFRYKKRNTHNDTTH